jgi:hypothetical protein
VLKATVQETMGKKYEGFLKEIEHTDDLLLYVHFISSRPVKQRFACMAWADKMPVQMVWAESSTRPGPAVVDGAFD